MTGLLIALIPAFVWGIMPLLLSRFAKTNNRVQMLGTGLGIAIAGCIVTLMLKPEMANPLPFFMSFLSGAGWMVGMYGQFVGYRTIGTAKTFPLSSGLQIIINALLGWLILHEWVGAKEIGLGFLGVLITVSGILLCNVVLPIKKMEKEEFHPTMVVILTTLGYCMYSLLPKIAPTEDALSQVLPQSLGILSAGIFFAIIMRKTEPLPKAELGRMTILGVLYSVATISYLVSIQMNGMVKGFLIAQLNIVMATLMGIYIFHEKREVSTIRTLIGLAGIFAGCTLIVLI